MSTELHNTPLVIELNCEDDGAHVKVIPANKDVMMLTVRAAIAACRAYDEQLKFDDQFKQLLPTLGAWLGERRNRIVRGCLTVAETGLMFLVVLKDKHYDPEIEDELTELELAIANDSDFSLLRVGALAIPQLDDAAIQAFLDPDRAISYKNAK